MAGLSFGLVFAAGLALLHLGMIVVPLRRFRTDLISVLLPCVFTMIAFNGSSSFMGGGLEGTTFWVFLALYHAAAYDRPVADVVTPEGDLAEPAEPAPLAQVRPVGVSPSGPGTATMGRW